MRGNQERVCHVPSRESLSLVIDIVDGDAGNGNGVDDERSHVRVGDRTALATVSIMP